MLVSKVTDLMLFYKGIDLLLIIFSSPSNCILVYSSPHPLFPAAEGARSYTTGTQMSTMLLRLAKVK